MYRPPAFREDRIEILHQAIVAYPLAMLVTSGACGISANLIPFTLQSDAGERGVLQAHLAKANSQLADLRAGAEALVIFQGPQAYVSPSWYPTKRVHGKVVPTWNYVMVQARGRPAIIDDPDWLRVQIDALTGQQEQYQPEPWSVADAPASYIEGQLKGITGIEIAIDRIEGKWKASQNHPASNKAGVIDGLMAQNSLSPMALIMHSLADSKA
ncbi:FMN-binding negative transcriptional regulator [Sphingobium sp. AS12]|uniref:FMN-binding negative transcriptional regulator n=1 Tax=Sphingobium sp. AS12 TaxID=2849495 RepID=UPI001C31DECE|nr:FMN-binding negative transcriptional regulator [Sphingobium sp. AS12]MBV2148213.1 FMN-binding negative transcriptional regulator [Sphingobium sp. AS12]